MTEPVAPARDYRQEGIARHEATRARIQEAEHAAITADARDRELVAAARAAPAGTRAAASARQALINHRLYSAHFFAGLGANLQENLGQQATALSGQFDRMLLGLGSGIGALIAPAFVPGAANVPYAERVRMIRGNVDAASANAPIAGTVGAGAGVAGGGALLRSTGLGGGIASRVVPAVPRALPPAVRAAQIAQRGGVAGQVARGAGRAVVTGVETGLIGAGAGGVEGGVRTGTTEGAVAGTALGAATGAGVGTVLSAGGGVLAAPTRVAMRALSENQQLMALARHLNEPVDNIAARWTAFTSRTGRPPASIAEVLNDEQAAREAGDMLGKHIPSANDAIARADALNVTRQRTLSTELANGAAPVAARDVVRAAHDEFSGFMRANGQRRAIVNVKSLLGPRGLNSRVRSIVRDAKPNLLGRLHDAALNDGRMTLTLTEADALHRALGDGPLTSPGMITVAEELRNSVGRSFPDYEQRFTALSNQLARADGITAGRGVVTSGGTTEASAVAADPLHGVQRAAGQGGGREGATTALLDAANSPNGAIRTAERLSRNSGLLGGLETVLGPAEATRLQRVGAEFTAGAQSIAAITPERAATQTASRGAVGREAIGAVLSATGRSSAAFRSNTIMNSLSRIGIRRDGAMNLSRQLLSNNPDDVAEALTLLRRYASPEAYANFVSEAASVMPAVAGSRVGGAEAVEASVDEQAPQPAPDPSSVPSSPEQGLQSSAYYMGELERMGRSGADPQSPEAQAVADAYRSARNFEAGAAPGPQTASVAPSPAAAPETADSLMAQMETMGRSGADPQSPEAQALATRYRALTLPPSPVAAR